LLTIKINTWAVTVDDTDDDDDVTKEVAQPQAK